MTGILHGIGVGPGDPELLTLKAVRLIAACPVLAYPAPESGPSLAREIAAPHVPAGRIECPVRLPIEIERHPAREAYDAGAGLLAAHLSAGRDVALLCLGDPLFYGSFMYLHARLADRFDCRIVPGVTSFAASAALSGHALAARADSVAVVPATLDDGEIERRIAAHESLVFLKLGRHFARLKALLERAGLAADALYVERAGMTDERCMALADVAHDQAPYFSLVLVHRRAKAWK
ncbi:MAG: precorrin-2 C(20)-methyltransferase [Alphaproteobacteria bacterium]|nr:precorrin-2 C(20)-methyltransferase [Alphaproteobacteria bacterium]